GSTFRRGAPEGDASPQGLGVCWTFSAGLRIVDIDRVNAHENGTRLDQVRRSLGTEVRCPGGVRRGTEVPIPASMQKYGGALQLAVVERRSWNPALCSVGQPEQLQRQVHQRL